MIDEQPAHGADSGACASLPLEIQELLQASAADFEARCRDRVAAADHQYEQRFQAELERVLADPGVSCEQAQRWAAVMVGELRGQLGREVSQTVARLRREWQDRDDELIAWAAGGGRLHPPVGDGHQPLFR